MPYLLNSDACKMKNANTAIISDAIALALRAKAPIYVNETVIEAAKSLDLPDTSKTNTEDKDQWKRWLDNIKPQDFGNL